MTSNANEIDYSDLFVIDDSPDINDGNTIPSTTCNNSDADDLYPITSFKTEEPKASSNLEEEPKPISDLENPGAKEDTDEEYVHDQLPSVDEIIRNASTPSVFSMVKSSRKTRPVLTGCSILSILALVTYLIAMSGGKGDKGAPTFEPTSRLDDVIFTLFENKVSTLPDLSSPHTAQRKAAQFLADGDILHLEIGEEDPNHLIERYVLSLLYYHFNGPQWNFQLNFLSGMDHCEWWAEIETPSGQKLREGVLCDDDGDVIGLNLGKYKYMGIIDACLLTSSGGHMLTKFDDFLVWNNLAWNNLQGHHLPSEIRYLDKLEKLHLYFNEIGGELPYSMQEMSNLKSFVIMHCDLEGEIPSWLGDMTQLSVLALGSNQFHGEVPSNFSKLNNLKLLGLDDGKGGFTGDLAIFKSLKSLEALYLGNNRFTGSLGGGHVWPNMRELDVSNNMLTGSIPASMLAHSSLQVLDLHNNFFSGNFPNNGLVGNDKLEYLTLYSNVIQGTLSDRLGFFKNLKHLDLSYNRMSGTLPDTLTQLTELRYLATSGNFFDEQPILDFSALTNLVDISMKANHLTGTIPDWFGGLSNLKLLDLDANELKGNIPTWFGLLQNLRHLLLNRNHLTGTLPTQLQHLRSLDVFLIDGNSIHGNAQVICESDSVKPSIFISDCYPGENGEQPEINCRCCTTCCRDGDTECNNKNWASNYDPVWEYGYVRPSYHFSVENAPAMISKEYDNDSGEFAGPMDPFDIN